MAMAEEDFGTLKHGDRVFLVKPPSQGGWCIELREVVKVIDDERGRTIWIAHTSWPTGHVTSPEWETKQMFRITSAGYIYLFDLETDAKMYVREQLLSELRRFGWKGKR